MLSADLHAISDLLDKALDLEARAREPWLADLARTEPGLASTLRALLSRQGELETDQLLIDGGRALGSAALANAIDGRTDASMASTTPESPEFTPQFILQAGTTIGPYRLIRPLGEGGMASVWLAERIDGQLKREIALKLLHAWRNSRELVERFARERDMLAGLVHPNIARLYDAGVTANGQPWIALEYVEGLDFAAYADQNALSIRQRVESILQVMAAVQYAHQNLIVHRDLKPTNILVNKKGEVRLLDLALRNYCSRRM
jgi:eukaryotic-like serine/threonine-protein kinase